MSTQTYTIIPTNGTARTISANIDTLYDEVDYIAEGAELFGGICIGGTYAIAHCDAKGCGGHEVARVYLTGVSVNDIAAGVPA